MISAEVLVIGAGPAGIAAATAAATHGRRVVLLDDNAHPGGQIWRHSVVAAPSAERQKHSALRRLAAAGAQLEMGWQVFDAPCPGILSATNGGRVEEFAYRQLILATGARERFLPFPGWTLPGVFGAGGLQALVKSGFRLNGKRVAVAGSGPLLLAVAAFLIRHGAQVVSVAEQAPLTQLLPFVRALFWQPGKLCQGMRYRAIFAKTPYRTNCWPVAAVGVNHVTGIRLQAGKRIWEESCDLIACGFHLGPNTELAALLGCSFQGDYVAVDEWQQTSIANVYCAGEPVAIAGLDGALIQGTIAGLACAGQLKEAKALRGRRTSVARFANHLKRAFRLRRELNTHVEDDSIVCRCEDVRYRDLSHCTSWTEAKLQTRCGMGPCQGRICGPITQSLFDWQPSSIRPPLFPVPLKSLCQISTATQEE
jgi:NADPH-dependent 2,4-dienoyl-CoA reductase/sulfur reductase-like enzyme